MQTFLVQPATGSLTGKYPSRTCVHPTCVALIIHLEIPDVSRNSWHNHQSTQGCVKLCLTLTQCSTAELLGASPSAAWCCSGLGSSATTAGRGCAPALCDFPSCRAAVPGAGQRGTRGSPQSLVPAAAAGQEWCPQASGLSSVSHPVTGFELWMWIPSHFWSSCDVLLTSYDQKCYFSITHDCVCYVVGVWASDWRLLVWTTLWGRLFQGWRYDSFEVL